MLKKNNNNKENKTTKKRPYHKVTNTKMIKEMEFERHALMECSVNSWFLKNCCCCFERGSHCVTPGFCM